MDESLVGSNRPPVSADSGGRRASWGTFIGRHWRGEFELGPSYWLCGSLLSVLVLILTVLIARWAAVNITEAPRLTSFAIAITTSLVLPVSIWQSVGIWRSASRRAQQRKAAGKATFWPIMTRLSVILSALLLAYSFGRYRIPNTIAYLQIAFGGDRTPHHVIRLFNGGRVVALGGGFDFGTADALRTVLDASPGVRTVELNSIGGRVAEAEQVRRIIVARHLATYTATMCASACTVAYIGGSPRYLATGARLAFHEYSFPGLSPQQNAAINGHGESTLIDAGVSPWFAQKAFTTPPLQLWAPDVATLLAAHVVTRQLSGYWPSVTGMDVAGFLRGLTRVPSFAALQKYDPTDYAQLQQNVDEAIQAGAPPAELNARVRLPLLQALARYLPVAGDAVQIEHAKVMADEATALAPSHPDICVALFDGSRSVTAYIRFLPDVLRRRDVAMTANIIASGASAPSDVRDDPPLARTEAAKIARAVRSDGVDISALGRKPVTSDDQRKVCLFMADFLRHVSALPPNEAGPLMRGRLAGH
jgi:hypothetical protein